MATEYTYIEKEGVGYKTTVSDAVKLLLKDYMEEVISYPAGDTVIEEIVTDGVVIAMANGRQVTRGTYPLYEEFNQITNAVYNLPDYTTKKNVISNFPNSGKIAGDKIDWLPPTHSHAEKIPTEKIKVTGSTTGGIALYTMGKESPVLKPTHPYLEPLFTWNNKPLSLLNTGEELSNNSTDIIKKEYQPALLPLTPYIVVDYRG